MHLSRSTPPHTPPLPPVSRADRDLTKYLGAVRVIPSFKLTSIMKGIDRMGDEARASALEELSDLAKRCEEAEHIGPGLMDHGGKFEKRLSYICESEAKFRALDSLSGLNPNIVDPVALVEGAHKCAEHFMQPRAISERQQRDIRFDDPGFLLERLESLGIEAPASLKSEQIKPRVTDFEWWKKVLRQNLRVRRENGARALDARKIKWCSDDGLVERRDHDLRQTEWASKMVFSDGKGGTFPCPTPAESAKRQYAELLARNAATANEAREAGLNDCCILTCTTPSNFHAVTEIGEGRRKRRIRNKNWDMSTPADAVKWLRTRWARMRAALKRRRIGKFFLLCTHIHLDETPHIHVIFFEKKENFAKIEVLAKERFDGGSEEQVTLETCDQERGLKYAARAVAYIARDVQNLGGLDGDEGGEDRELEAAATKQAAATFRFRRYSTSQGGITAYRLARRRDVLPDVLPENEDADALSASEVETATTAKEMRTAAMKGDFLSFYKLYQERKGKIHRSPATNRYGEPILSVRGLELDGIIYTKSISWKIERKGATEGSTVTVMCQGGEAAEPQTQKTERQEAREWLENYIKEQEKKPKPIASNEEWLKIWESLSESERRQH